MIIRFGQVNDMKTKIFCGKEVPRVGFGCMGMSEFYGESDDKNSIKLLREAFDYGYKHFDTANMYGRGHNEKLLSNFISDLTSSELDSAVIASKVGIERHKEEKYSISVNNSRAYIRKCCEDSLIRLGVECLDLYYLHRLDPASNVEEVMHTFVELIKEGKIKHIGLCEVDTETLKKASDIHKISALQSEYSLWSRNIEDNILPYCINNEIDIVAFSPLGRGFLTGAITKSISNENDLRTRLPRFNSDNIAKNTVVLERFDQLISTYGLDKSQVAISWILSQSCNIHVIPGTRSSKFMESNFRAQYIDLSDEMVNEISDIFLPGSISGDRYPSAIKPK